MRKKRWQVFAGILTCLLFGVMFASGQEREEGIRLMTFNIRYGAADDGPNSWPNRRDLVANLIRQEGPDVLAIQEGLAFQLDELSGVLEGYRKFGHHRDGGLEGEFSGLYVRVGSIEVLDWGELWLSPTPDSVGSVGWDAALPRMAVWADAREIQGGKTLRVYGTHYDHRGTRARSESSQLLLAHADNGPPAVFMGDFNAAEEAEPVARFLDRGFRSAVLAHNPELAIGTFNGFRDATGGRRIDHILVGPEIRVDAAAIIHTADGDPWPSDHYPVTAVIRVR